MRRKTIRTEVAREKQVLHFLWEKAKQGVHKEHRKYIIELSETFLTKTHLVFVLEYPGACCTLNEKYQQQTDGRTGLSVLEILNVTAQLLYALAFLKHHQVVHRDLKANNVLVIANATTTDSVHIKLVDFGRAKIMEKNDAGSRRSSTFLGIGHSTPPECLCQTSCQYRFQSEMWSLGILITEMITGRIPICIAGTPQELAQQIRDFDISEHMLEVRGSFSALLGKEQVSSATLPTLHEVVMQKNGRKVRHCELLDILRYCLVKLPDDRLQINFNSLPGLQ